MMASIVLGMTTSFHSPLFPLRDRIDSFLLSGVGQQNQPDATVAHMYLAAPPQTKCRRYDFTNGLDSKQRLERHQQRCLYRGAVVREGSKTGSELN